MQFRVIMVTVFRQSRFEVIKHFQFNVIRMHVYIERSVSILSNITEIFPNL